MSARLSRAHFFTVPVAIETLRATSDAHGRVVRVLTWGRRLPEAKIWSRKLRIITIVLVFMALAGDVIGKLATQFLPTGEGESLWPVVAFIHVPLLVLDTLLPFTYCGVGACAHLFRICKDFLFTTAERVMADISPKVGLELTQRSPSPQAPAASLLEDLTLWDLLDRRDKTATQTDRQLYEDLIACLKDRL